MKAKIPLWINILQVVILVILAFQAYASYFNPQLLVAGLTLDATTSKLVYTLAGRNTVMLIISIIALATQNPRFYSFAFLMHGLREVQDMVINPLTGAPLPIFFVFLIVFVIPEVLAFLKLRRMVRVMDSLPNVAIPQ